MSIRPSAWPTITGLRVAEIEQFAREYARAGNSRRPGPDPLQLRPAAARRRRHGRPHHLLPARAHRRLALPRRRRVAQHQQGLCLRQGRPRAARPDSARHPHRQHDPTGRGACTANSPARRCRRLYVYNSQPRRRLSGSIASARRASAATTSSPSSTSNSRPTPPTTPTSCSPPRRNWSTSTSTAVTATSTCRPTTLPSHRSAKRSRTPKCSGCSAERWDLKTELFAASDEEVAREMHFPTQAHQWKRVRHH